MLTAAYQPLLTSWQQDPQLLEDMAPIPALLTFLTKEENAPDLVRYAMTQLH